MMNNKWIILFLAFVVFGCHSPDYPGYNFKYGFHYKLSAIGSNKIGESKILGITYSVFSLSKNELLNTKTWPVYLTPENSLLDAFLERWNVGDSLTVILTNEKECRGMFSKYLPTDPAYFPLELSVNIKHAVESDQFESWYKRQLTNKQQLDEYLLLLYLEKNGLAADSSYQGIYFESISEDVGEEIIAGEEVWLKYTGYFLDGHPFDMLDEDEFFYYHKGVPDQLIDGLEIAIGRMKKGMKAKIVIPSHLAFGATGSSTGTVPPYTSVIYELEIKKEKNGQ